MYSVQISCLFLSFLFYFFFSFPNAVYGRFFDLLFRGQHKNHIINSSQIHENNHQNHKGGEYKCRVHSAQNKHKYKDFHFSKKKVFSIVQMKINGCVFSSYLRLNPRPVLFCLEMP